jgi:hypothetical protein
MQNGGHKHNSKRLLSMPDVLLNAATINKHQGSRSSSIVTPRARMVNLFAHQAQLRPVYSPNCHPIDLAGLQETAV